MRARNYWNINCIDYKEYYQEVLRYLNKASEDSLTAEEFEGYSSNHIDPMEFLGLSNEELDSTAPQELETIRDKAYQIYDDCYEDVKEDCRENYGWF